jgi:pimeloyl-ACP methyl ester carboxylesterase
MDEFRSHQVQCLSPAGLHRMHYREWGDAANPRVLVCVHGLTRCGRDFDHLARALSVHWRVVCPDVVGRGDSDWLRDPAHYRVPQYVADMVALIARLGVPEVDWLGTSMGGLIGIGLAGLPEAPVRRLILNDVGPSLELAGLQRIAEYVGRAPRFAGFEEALEYVRGTSPGFGLRHEAQWRELTASVVRPDGRGYVFAYDPAISIPMRALGAAEAALGENLLWGLYDAILAPTLLIRGAQSDLLSEATAEMMTLRGPRAQRVDLEGVGHAPMFFDADQIEVVRRFLERAPI